MSLTLRKQLDVQAELGDAQACLNLFEEYQNESGHQAAIDWLDEALDFNCASAQYIAGVMDLNAGKMEEGIDYLELACANDNAQAMMVLGQFYLGNVLGFESIEVNLEKGLDYLMQAAHKGSAQAALILGKCYFIGQWVHQDVFLATLWLEKAEALGNGEARILLDEVVCAHTGFVQ